MDSRRVHFATLAPASPDKQQHIGNESQSQVFLCYSELHARVFPPGCPATYSVRRSRRCVAL